MPSDERVTGWGVIQVHPWHLAGIFPTQAEAVARKAELTPGYIVRFGVGFPKSGDFFWDSRSD